MFPRASPVWYYVLQGASWLTVPLFALWLLEAWLTRVRLRDLPGLPGPGGARRCRR